MKNINGPATILIINVVSHLNRHEVNRFLHFSPFRSEQAVLKKANEHIKHYSFLQRYKHLLYLSLRGRKGTGGFSVPSVQSLSLLFNRARSGTAAQTVPVLMMIPSCHSVEHSIHHPVDRSSLLRPREQFSVWIQKHWGTDLSLTSSPPLSSLETLYVFSLQSNFWYCFCSCEQVDWLLGSTGYESFGVILGCLVTAIRGHRSGRLGGGMGSTAGIKGNWRVPGQSWSCRICSVLPV